MKIGIITMHRVLNFGSALQAYALQKAIATMGYECEIINYVFPNQVKRNKVTIRRIINDSFVFFRNLIFGFPTYRKKKKFNEFYKKYYNLSNEMYYAETINKSIPQYDLYMSGSDQVWNPKIIVDDKNFLLTFVPESQKRVSYGSSFAVNSIPDNLKAVYKKELNKFDFLNVREKHGCKIIKDLIGKESCYVCDPTMLLDRDEWDVFADSVCRYATYPYILVYILEYMFNPYPEIERIVSSVQKSLGYKIIYLNGRKEDFFKRNSKLNKDSGPCEVLSLIKNAEFVITTSFHGVVFSSIFEVPFLGVVKDKAVEGDRIVSLLTNLRCNKSLVNFDETVVLECANVHEYACKRDALNRFRNESRKILIEMLKQEDNG